VLLVKGGERLKFEIVAGGAVEALGWELVLSVNVKPMQM
jgi:hypothetical protein